MYQDIQNSTQHRTSPMPDGEWVMTQKWNHLLYMHYPVSIHTIESYIPDGLELDTFNGEAWISIIPFQIKDMRLRNMPQLPYFHSFSELNVRTYVKRNGVPGIFFFSLDASKRFAVIAARMGTLPYFYANITMKQQDESIHYTCRRKNNSNKVFEGEYRPIGEAFYPDVDSLDHWLLERYYLYSYQNECLYFGGIHHKPLEVYHAEAAISKQHMSPFIVGGKPLVHYVTSKRVLFWLIKKVK